MFVWHIYCWSSYYYIWRNCIFGLCDEIKIIFRGQLIENYDWTEKSIDIITIIVFALGGLTTFLNGIKEKEARTKEINEAVDKQFKLYLESKDDDLR